MEIVKPKVELINPPSYEDVLDTFNHAARNCYKSLNEKTDNKESAEKLARRLISIGHGSPIEMNNITVKFVQDRALLSQLSRHRLLSLAVESMRYCNYSLDKFNNSVNFIVPAGMTSEGYESWRASCLVSESAYFDLIERGLKPEIARSVLPMCTATSIIASGNIREWRHVLDLRCDSHAQTDIRNACKELLSMLYSKYEVFFEDLYKKYNQD